MMEELVKFLGTVCFLSDAFLEYLLENAKSKAVKKGNYLLKEGWVCENMYFVQSGLFRCFYINKQNEHNSWFIKENELVISILSFYDQVPSYEYIQALEDATVIYISFKAFEQAKERFVEMNRLRADLLEHYYKLNERKNYSLRAHAASQRFEYLMESQPELIGRVSDKHLASYLGLSPFTFSRCKRNYLAKKGKH